MHMSRRVGISATAAVLRSVGGAGAGPGRRLLRDEAAKSLLPAAAVLSPSRGTGAAVLAVVASATTVVVLAESAGSDQHGSEGGHGADAAKYKISERQRRGEKGIKEWTAGIVMDKLNKGDPEANTEPGRHVIALIGFTGAGKSSTGNTLMKGCKLVYRKFAVSGSLTSLTRSVKARDFDVRGVPYRVIDMPGLGDTNRTEDDIASELERLANYAPHGISAFLVVVPHGRMTSEQEAALRSIRRLFGDSVADHTMVVVTRAIDPKAKNLKTRDMLLENVRGLPPRHFLRLLVDAAEHRLVGVENILEPWRSRSQLMLLQGVLDVEERSGRYDCQHFIDERKRRSKAAWIREGQDGTAEPLCKHTVVFQHGGGTELRMHCSAAATSEMPTQLSDFLNSTRASVSVPPSEYGTNKEDSEPAGSFTKGRRKPLPVPAEAKAHAGKLTQASNEADGMTKYEMIKQAQASPGLAYMPGN